MLRQARCKGCLICIGERRHSCYRSFRSATFGGLTVPAPGADRQPQLSSGLRRSASSNSRMLSRGLPTQGGPTADFGINRLEYLTVIDASRLLTADYSWRVFDISARQR